MGLREIKKNKSNTRDLIMLPLANPESSMKNLSAIKWCIIF